MHKGKILEGVKAGSPLPFFIPYPEEKAASSYIKEQFEQLEQAEEQLRSTPTEALGYETFRLYWETGDRNTYQALYYGRRKRLLVYAMLLWREPTNEAYKKGLENILWDIAAEPVWALPAHFLDKEEQGLPVSEYALQIDLFAAETAFALVETLRMCEHLLAPQCVQFVRQQLEKRIVEPFLDGNKFYRFEVMANNWAAVCAGAVGCVGIMLIEDEEVLVNFLHRILSTIEVYIDSFHADGICVEGVDYWTYGFGFFVCFADYLSQRTGGMIDLLKAPKIEQIALGQQAYYLVEDHTISFADGTAVGRFRVGLSMFLAEYYPTFEVPDLRYGQSVLDDSCYRFCLALRDILWLDPVQAAEQFSDGKEKSQLNNVDTVWAKWYADAQWWITKSDTFIVAAKGGNNGESHNHNDCGSFILYKNGKAMLEDLGAGVYDAKYFSPKRYENFITASRSHSVPLISGEEQVAGVAHAVTEVSVASTKEVATIEMELAACYNVAQLDGFRRSISHEAEGKIIVADHFLAPVGAEVVEQFISHSPITVVDRIATITNGTEELTMGFEEGTTLAVTTHEYKTHKGITRIAYRLEATSVIHSEEKQIRIVMI